MPRERTLWVWRGEGGWNPRGIIAHSFAGSFVWTDGQKDGRKLSPVFYRTSSPSGPVPKRRKEGRNCGVRKESKGKAEFNLLP